MVKARDRLQVLLGLDLLAKFRCHIFMQRLLAIYVERFQMGRVVTQRANRVLCF